MSVTLPGPHLRMMPYLERLVAKFADGMVCAKEQENRPFL
jgi:hypothetical protein